MLRFLGKSAHRKDQTLIPKKEASNRNLQSRLEYFREFVEKLRDTIDVIDDGSTDESLNEIKVFENRNANTFFFVFNFTQCPQG